MLKTITLSKFNRKGYGNRPYINYSSYDRPIKTIKTEIHTSGFFAKIVAFIKNLFIKQSWQN